MTDRGGRAAPLEPDPVIEAYKKDVDRTLLRENLKRTVEEIDIETAFRLLAQGGVEFIVVGGVAARAHGSARLTNDLHVVRDGRRTSK